MGEKSIAANFLKTLMTKTTTILFHFKIIWARNSRRVWLRGFPATYDTDGDNLVVFSWQINYSAGSHIFSLGILVWMVGRLGFLDLHLLLRILAKKLQQS